jgi:hypothetical protein
LLKEFAQWEQQIPARAFAEVALAHKSKRCLATHARQLVIARLLTNVVHAPMMQDARLGQRSGMTPDGAAYPGCLRRGISRTPAAATTPRQHRATDTGSTQPALPDLHRTSESGGGQLDT